MEEQEGERRKEREKKSNILELCCEMCLELEFEFGSHEHDRECLLSWINDRIM